MKKNVIQEKSYSFALRIVRLYKYLCEEKKEYILSKQLRKSGTSIGANIEEGLSGQSKKDFIAKLQIALKEARETNYWLRLLRDSGFIESKLIQSLFKDCSEIEAILVSILKTSKLNS